MGQFFEIHFIYKLNIEFKKKIVYNHSNDCFYFKIDLVILNFLYNSHLKLDFYVITILNIFVCLREYLYLGVYFNTNSTQMYEILSN